jgi:pyridoxamine 5'-phosphate oxidase
MFDSQRLPRDPIELFHAWLDAAKETLAPLPESMALATTNLSTGRPSVRMVMLHKATPQGFTFYTDYSSRKGQELSQNPSASLLFFWGNLGYQVRVEGNVNKVDVKESDEYFNGRQRGSQLAAWASQQSSAITSLTDLRQEWENYGRQFPSNVPRPQRWGGYRLRHQLMEFWKGDQDRLHDRILYTRQNTSSWSLTRLSP